MNGSGGWRAKLSETLVLVLVIAAELLRAYGSERLLAAVGAGRSTLDLLAGGAVGGAVFWLLALASRGGLGGGDVKLAVLVGLVAGASRLPVVLTVTALSGGVLALGVLALGQSRRALIPYGPCLVLGGIVALLGD